MGFFKPVIVNGGGSAIELADNLTTTTKGMALDASQAPVIVSKIPDVSGLAKKSDIPTIPDLSGYAKKTDIPDMSKYAYKTDLISKGAFTIKYDNNSVQADMTLSNGDIMSTRNNPGYAYLYGQVTPTYMGTYIIIIESRQKDVTVGISVTDKSRSMPLSGSGIVYTYIGSGNKVHIQISLSSYAPYANIPFAHITCLKIRSTNL